MPDVPVGGTATVQKLLFEAEAALPGGLARVSPRSVRHYVRQGLEQRVADPSERLRHWRAFEAAYAQVDLAAADRALEQYRLDRETFLALRGDPPPPLPSPASSSEPSEPCVPVAVAAVRLGVSPVALRGRISRGTIRSLLVNRLRVIPVAELEAAGA